MAAATKKAAKVKTTGRKSAKKIPQRAILVIDAEKRISWRVDVSLGADNITVPVPNIRDALDRVKRGNPWACLIADAISHHAKAHPDEFPIQVDYPYVTKTAVFLVDERRKNGQPCHALKFRHNLGACMDEFDKLKSKTKFLKTIEGDELTLKLSPGRPLRHGESRGGGNGGGGSRTKTVLNGARRRAVAAALLPE